MTLITKIASTMLGTKITADTSKAGLPGIALGVLATRMMTRSPLGTLFVGGAWLGHKIWQKKREIDAAGSKGRSGKSPAGKNKSKPLPRRRSSAASKGGSPAPGTAAARA